jgi:hypothetical protein
LDQILGGRPVAGEKEGKSAEMRQAGENLNMKVIRAIHVLSNPWAMEKGAKTSILGNTTSLLRCVVFELSAYKRPSLAFGSDRL